MFANDVMVFFDGSEFYLHGINEASHTEDEVTALDRHGFQAGLLPIRYLGLPLMHRKLRISEYEPLVEKIACRFRGWAVKSLSFADRAQLIASLIYGTVNFWMSTFMISSGCIQKIESICSSFLWSGNIESGRGAKVSLSNVCVP